jgi:hypothetical protein
MPGFAPLLDSGYSTAHLRHCPYDEWLDGVPDVFAYRLRGSRTFGPYATAAIRTHLPLIRDYPPRASHFRGGQRRFLLKFLDLWASH